MCPLLDDSYYAFYDYHVLYNVLRILYVPYDNSRFLMPPSLTASKSLDANLYYGAKIYAKLENDRVNDILPAKGLWFFVESLKQFRPCRSSFVVLSRRKVKLL